jgi:hypothetical protein
MADFRRGRPILSDAWMEAREDRFLMGIAKLSFHGF